MIKEVLDVMIELAESGMTMMVVTHEMGFAVRWPTRCISSIRADRGERDAGADLRRSERGAHQAVPLADPLALSVRDRAFHDICCIESKK
jgi:energy-coupling factor transporter ATP-binding protein EcfA2